MVNLDLSKPAEHELRHRPPPGSHLASAFPQIVVEVAPGLLECLARSTQVMRELVCGAWRTGLDVSLSHPRLRVLAADLTEPSAVEQPNVTVGVARQMRDDVAAGPSRQQTRRTDLLVAQGADSGEHALVSSRARFHLFAGPHRRRL